MCLILLPFRRIDLDHIKLALFSVPMENTLYTCPPTPLQTPPARLGAAHANLRYTRDVYVRPIDARIPPSRAPRLFHVDDNRAARGPARAPIRRSACPPLTSHKHALTCTLTPISTAAAQPLLRFHVLITHVLRPSRLPIITESMPLPPGALALRRRLGRPLASV